MRLFNSNLDHPIRKVFKSIPAPRDGVVVHLVHFEEEQAGDGEGLVVPEYWTVRLYRDNFDTFSKEDQFVLFNWVSDIIRTMRLIEPRTYLEVFERMPR